MDAFIYRNNVYFRIRYAVVVRYTGITGSRSYIFAFRDCDAPIAQFSDRKTSRLAIFMKRDVEERVSLANRNVQKHSSIDYDIFRAGIKTDDKNEK